MYPYRVFISYSHEDSTLANIVRKHLTDIHVQPMSDVDIPDGARFSDEIRHQISYAHVFVSILTKNSKTRPWVHQELGYAMGLGVPILPLALDQLPEGMAQEIQAIRVDPELRDLAERLTPRTLQHLVSRSQQASRAMFECADDLHQRTEVLVKYAKSLLLETGPAKLRLRMAFSSFSLPNKGPKHTDWEECEGSEKRSENERKLLRQEREVFEEHACGQGCDMILDPYVSAEAPERRAATTRFKHGVRPTVKRLQILSEFLANMPDEKVRVVIERGKIDGSVILIGDRLSAEAVVPHYKSGYKQTIFTRHAPTVLAKLVDFDRDFEESLKDSGLIGRSSRLAAIEAIDRIIANADNSRRG